MSEFETVESLRINESNMIAKTACTVDLEDDLARLELTTTANDETEEVIFEPSEVSSFRKRLTEAQLTDNLSESTVATETIDIITERVWLHSYCTDCDPSYLFLHRPKLNRSLSLLRWTQH